jgi:hypothetical protein
MGEPDAAKQLTTQTSGLPDAELSVHQPLERLRDTERFLRERTVRTIVPWLSPELATQIEDLSDRADESLTELANIDLTTIDDKELRPARIFAGLTFVGFGALMVLFLLLYFGTLHPALGRNGWYTYIWFVCLGVAGMFMLSREAMRSSKPPEP